MAEKRCTWYEVVQLLILLFTMSLMLSKHYEIFGKIFSFFYETEVSYVCVIVGAFSVLHGMLMVGKSFVKK